LAEKNHIFDELKGSDENLKHENELYKELIEFEKLNLREQKENIPSQHSNIIDFHPVAKESKNQSAPPIRLAAESSDIEVSKSLSKSNFLLSSDGKYAIKYSVKHSNEIQLQLLSDSDINVTEAILYSPVINKHFVSAINGEFVVGQYSDFDLGSFDFKAIFPKEKILVLKQGDSFSVLSANNLKVPEVLEVTSSFLRIKVSLQADMNVVVLQTAKTKDFLKLENGIVEIPIILLEQRVTLFMY